MRYLPCWKQIGISKERYQELLYFCRQYPRWLAEANSLLGLRAVRNDGLPHGSGKSDPVAMAAEKREKILAKIAVVDQCARSVGHGEWYTAMIEHVCNKKSYDYIDKTLMPTSDRNTFYKQRRSFFEILNKVKD